MIQVLDDDMTLFFEKNFPYKTRSKGIRKKKKSNSVTLGIGGNIGDVIQRFQKLFFMLQSDSRFNIEKTSPILKNPPFGYLEQDYFFNAIIVLQTNLTPIEALSAFQKYELLFKRTRSFQDAPRTLDIDIIFFNNLKIDTPRLTIPHKGYKVRPSVLIPLEFVS